jgi:hypothetical protein
LPGGKEGARERLNRQKAGLKGNFRPPGDADFTRRAANLLSFFTPVGFRSFLSDFPAAISFFDKPELLIIFYKQ